MNHCVLGYVGLRISNERIFALVSRRIENVLQSIWNVFRGVARTMNGINETRSRDLKFIRKIGRFVRFQILINGIESDADGIIDLLGLYDMATIRHEGRNLHPMDYFLEIGDRPLGNRRLMIETGISDEWIERDLKFDRIVFHGGGVFIVIVEILGVLNASVGPILQTRIEGRIVLVDDLILIVLFLRIGRKMRRGWTTNFRPVGPFRGPVTIDGRLMSVSGGNGGWEGILDAVFILVER